jgi:LPXTG-motif cell wall-anchored protein
MHTYPTAHGQHAAPLAPWDAAPAQFGSAPQMPVEAAPVYYEPPPAAPSRKWTRYAIVILGAAIVTFAGGNAYQSLKSAGPESGGKTESTATDATTDELDFDGTSQASDLSSLDSDAAAADKAPSANANDAATSTPKPAAKPPKPAGGKHVAARHGGKHAAGPHAVAGAGTGPDGLPMTGASTWIAALAGMLFLGGGLMLHLRAEEVAETASGYQRGPALRPVAYMRSLVDQAGTGGGFLRAIADRLLAEPEREFVSPRYGRFS